MENSNKITPVYLLLPVFNEMKQDVFLNLLQKIVARTKFGDGIESAFSSGMTAKTLFIESEDLSENDSNDTMSRHIRLTKLMGFWAVNNFPSLGRKLLGENWNPTEDRTVTIGSQQTMDSKGIDAIVFQKLKLRVIQLSVSKSTMCKIKHFVTVHASICESNPVDISKKMKMFAIQDAFINDCWQALKNGTFKMNTDFEQQIAIDRREIDQRRSEEGAQSISTVERSILPIDVTAIDPPDGAESILTAEDATFSRNRTVAAVKRCQVVIDSIDSQPMSTGKRSRVAKSDPVIDDLRSGMQIMAQDISKLTKWFDPEAELFKSRKTIDELQKILSESDRMQKELAAENQKLQKQLNEMATENAKLQGQLIDVNGHVEELKSNLADSHRKNLDVSSENGMLREQLSEANRYGQHLETKLGESDKKTMEMATENAKLQGQLIDVNGHVEELRSNLADSHRKNLDLFNENGMLREQLVEWKRYGNQLENKSTESDNKIAEMAAENAKLRTHLNDVTKPVEELKRKLDSSEKEKGEVIRENQTLWLQITELKNRFEAMVPEFQKQIQDLQMNASEQANHSRTCEDEVATIKGNSTEEIVGDPHLPTGQIGESMWEPEFETDDPIVLQCRANLKDLPFYWFKYKKTKKAKFFPGFVHPPEPGKNPEVQPLTSNGYISDKKFEYFNLQYTIDDSERVRHRVEIKTLNKFNELFGANFK